MSTWADWYGYKPALSDVDYEKVKQNCDQNHTDKSGKNTLFPPLYIVEGHFTKEDK